MIYLTLMVCLSTWVYEDARFKAHGTIDINLPELQYLAAHLEPEECRQLIAALHFHTYELPNNLTEADEDIPCLQHLLHWNSAEGEGRGTTHEPLEHRLRQLGRIDLADWLGQTTFEELSKDLLGSIDEPFGTLVDIERTTVETDDRITTESPDADDVDDEYFWHVIELIVMALFALLLFTLIVVVGLAVIDKFACCRQENKRISIDDGTDDEKRMLLSDTNFAHVATTETEEES